MLIKAATCPNTLCTKELLSRNAKACFIEVPVVHQLSTFFSRIGFYSDIQHRFNQKKSHPDNIEDIYDGALNKKLSGNGGFLSFPDNVSFLMNSDGVPVFKSSKVSIWPLYLLINELDYSLQMLGKGEHAFCGPLVRRKKASDVDFPQTALAIICNT